MIAGPTLKEFKPLLDYVSPLERELVGSLIAADPLDRASARDALELPIFSDAGDQYLLFMDGTETGAELKMSRVQYAAPKKGKTERKMKSE